MSTLILQADFHFSRMQRYHSMTPREKHASRPCRHRGFGQPGAILKIKVKIQGRESLSGCVISTKGDRVLDAAGLQ